MAQRFAPKIGLRGSAGYAYYELSMAQGPVAIGDTGNNELIDFIGYAWLLVMDEDRNLHLYHQTATVGEWEEVTVGLPPVFDTPLPEGTRRVTFAFDQSARVIVAYELAETVYVTRWDGPTNQYVQNVTFAGVDPVVMLDAVWAYDIPSSDILLFYLDAATRSKLMCRVQRQLFNTANELHDYGQAVVLDRVARVPLRYEVLAADAVGDPLTSGGGRIALISDPYPYLTENTLDSFTVPTGAWSHQAVLYAVAIEDSLDVSVAPAGAWSHVSILFVAEPDEDSLDASVVPLGAWSHVSILYVAEPDEDAMTASAAPQGLWSHVLTLIVPPPDEDTFDSSVVPTGAWAHKEA